MGRAGTRAECPSWLPDRARLVILQTLVRIPLPALPPP